MAINIHYTIPDNNVVDFASNWKYTKKNITFCVF